MKIMDNFLDSFDILRAYADDAIYADIENQADGVTYPGICSEIPRDIIAEINEKLGQITLSRTITLNSIFMRLSIQGAPVPHQAHNDSSMGRQSLMLYVNREEHCHGGTALVRHKETGIKSAPETEHELHAVQMDANTPSAWESYFLCEMKPNRACIFDAELMHRAEPVGGFGNNPYDGRLVLTAFFS